MINSGWANKCGKELFTLGWVPCDRRKGSGGEEPDKLHLRLLQEDEDILAVIMAAYINGT